MQTATHTTAHGTAEPEGETEDPEVIKCRARQQRNFLTTLFTAQGVPMLLGGDELGRTQKGNNNAYCQDNELSWVNWSEIDEPLLAFTRWIIAFRREHPVFRRRRFFQGRPIRGTLDIGWFKPDGQSMTDDDWDVGYARSLGVFLNGRAIQGHDEHGRPITDDSFILLFNAHTEGVRWSIPTEYAAPWRLVLDTRRRHTEREPRSVEGRITTSARSIAVLQTLE